MKITINYKGIDFEVSLDISAPDKETNYSGDMDVYGFTHKGTDFLEFFEADEVKITEIIDYTLSTLK
jgi:hypothetical protein